MLETRQLAIVASLLFILIFAFSACNRQHYDLTKKIMKCLDEKKRASYESRADSLNKKMKSKAKQINSVKAFQRQEASKVSSANWQLSPHN